MFFSIQENYELHSKKCEIIHIEHTVRILGYTNVCTVQHKFRRFQKASLNFNSLNRKKTHFKTCLIK